MAPSRSVSWPRGSPKKARRKRGEWVSQDEQNPYLTEYRFVGRERELAELRQLVRGGQSVVVIGGRKAGKTRLVAQAGDVGRPVYSTSADGWALTGEVDAFDAIASAMGGTASSRKELIALI